MKDVRTVIVSMTLSCLWVIPAFASEQGSMDVPGFNPVLDRALTGEPGVQVYVDKEGNVGTVIDAGPGHRTFSVQPPQSQSRNLGPPLQLHNRSLQLPLTPPDNPSNGKLAPGR